MEKTLSAERYDLFNLSLQAKLMLNLAYFHASTGPLNKQDGTPWLTGGETADDGTLPGMNFYVEGLTGTIPQ